MTVRTATPLGVPCWNDLASSDPERAKAFYAEILGWTADEPVEAYGGYVTFRRGDVPVAGIMRNDPGSGYGDGWTTYLATADAKASCDAVVGAGGTVVMEADEVADLGAMAIVSDPSGCTFGLWQPGRHMGFGVTDEVGTPAYHELHTRSYNAALTFYRTVFGWETRAVGDTDEWRYTNLIGTSDVDGSSSVGVMDVAAFDLDEVTGWDVYYGVADVDATVARVEELGGAVLNPAMDTPFGRLARVTDPTGAAFRLKSLRT